MRDKKLNNKSVTSANVLHEAVKKEKEKRKMNVQVVVVVCNIDMCHGWFTLSSTRAPGARCVVVVVTFFFFFFFHCASVPPVVRYAQ